MKGSSPSIYDDFELLIGVDWADKKHDICEYDAYSQQYKFSVIPHTPDAIQAWLLSLQERYPGKRFAIACELTKGPLINALQACEDVVIYPLNPSMVARYRKAFASSGSKSDPVDAKIQVEILQYHRDKSTPLKPQSDSIRQLNQLVLFRRKLVQDRVSLSNKITGILKQYFPQSLLWFKEKDTAIFCDFLKRWTTLEQAQAARKTTFLAFFSKHNSHYPDVNEARFTQLKAAKPLTRDEAIIKPNSLMISLLVPQLKQLLLAIRTLDEEIKELYIQHDDHIIFDSLPGAGPCYAPRLLAAFGEDGARYQSASDIQKYAGIAPVIEASGQKAWIHWRYHCPKFLRQSLVEWAGQTVRYSYWAKAFYEQQIGKGKSHNVAIRALTFKWIRIVWRCWQDRKVYDESTYLNALRVKGSQLLKYAVDN